jgi:hypothetical protein
MKLLGVIAATSDSHRLPTPYAISEIMRCQPGHESAKRLQGYEPPLIYGSGLGDDLRTDSDVFSLSVESKHASGKHPNTRENSPLPISR